MYKNILESTFKLAVELFISSKNKLFLSNINYFKKLNRSRHDQKLSLESEDGMAIVETIPLLSVFFILMTYALGYWGAIHSGILHSMAARNYALETFRNRTHLTQFRENQEISNDNPDYLAKKWEMRIHHITRIGGYREGSDSIAQTFPISFNKYKIDQGRQKKAAEFHNNLTNKENGNKGRKPASLGYGSPDSAGDNAIWLQIGHGICLNLSCGD